jgi:GWxTD domain-containing protein
MKIRTLITAVALVAIAAGNAFALSPEYVEWGKGGAHYFFTPEEAAKWKTIKTDEEAKAFVDLFWARRDPTPATPANEFRADIESRIKYTDEKFTPVRKKGTKGSMTDRGMFVILFGAPTKIANQAGNAVRPGLTATPTGADEAMAMQIWFYEGDAAKKLFGVPKVEFRFADRYGNQEYSFDRAGIDINGAKNKVIAASLTQPDLTKAPDFSAPAAAAPAPAAVAIGLSTPALKTAVDEFRGVTANPYDKQLFASWGEFVTATGETFVPVMLYVPKSAPYASQQNLTFFGEVQDASGKVVAAFEEPAKLTASKDDFFVDKSLPALPAGTHRGVFGLAADGKPVAMITKSMEVKGALDKDEATVSPLILANNMYPLTEAQRADDPFAFGGVKVVPKADKTFRRSDELWYFFELRNPGVTEAGAPKVQVKLDVEGKTDTGQPVKAANPPAEVDAIEMKGVPGHYGVGNALTLDGLDPGTYKFTVKVIDMVKKAMYTLTDSFRLVQ